VVAVVGAGLHERQDVRHSLGCQLQSGRIDQRTAGNKVAATIKVAGLDGDCTGH
jgi:uncharacterized membrane protein (DUF4010 family)